MPRHVPESYVGIPREHVRIALLARVPAFLLAGCYLLAVTREGDQVAALFDTLAFPGGHVVLIVIALVTGLVLSVLAERVDGLWRLADFVIYFLPVGILAFTFADSSWPRFLLAAIAVCSAILCHALARTLARQGWKLTLLVGLMTVAVWLAVHTAVTFSPVAFPRQVGALALVFGFLGFCAVGMQAALRHPAVGLPVLALVFAGFLFNERTHVINQEHRTDLENFENNEDNSDSVVSLQAALHVWAASRNDLEEYRSRERPYPVFVIASEGGGGYAAAHAYLFLSKLQRRCPNFAQHIFAIVGVSGGAVGNAMFHARLGDSTNYPTHQGCSSETGGESDTALLASDHLSPVLATMLFHDFPNRLLFGSLGPRSRADTLADSIAESLGGGGYEPNPLFQSHFLKTDEHGRIALGERPAIVHVATNAVSGRRYVFAPFYFRNPRGRFEQALLDLNWTGPDGVGWRSSDVRLLDAAVASASFPWITPSRILEGRLQERISLVDGGYLENAGAETARDIVAEIQRPAISESDAIHSITIPASHTPYSSMGSCRDTLAHIPVGSRPTGMQLSEDDLCRIRLEVHVIAIRAEQPYLRGIERQNFFFDPLTALLSARARRAETARFGLLSQLCGVLDCPLQTVDASDWGLHESVIHADEFVLPLGWHIPADRIATLEPYVAPLNADIPFSAAPSGNMAEILDWQDSMFATMDDNARAIEHIERILNPDRN